jgi:predicted ATPase
LEFERKTRPKPIFYGDLKKTAKYDLDAIRLVFEFELSLISVILPLYRIKKAQELVKYISKCYEININHVSEKCHELINLYDKDFKEESFNREFLNAFFMKVYYLLK